MKDIDFTGKLLANAGQNPKYMSSYPSGNAPTGTAHGARYVVNATGIQVASFGTKDAQQPAIWEQFKYSFAEGQPLNQLNPAWQIYAGNGAKLTAQSARYVGCKSAYNDHLDHQFATCYNSTLNPTDTVYLSYYSRILNWVDNYDYGVLKLSRITSNTAAGGGGVYNGIGSTSLGGSGLPSAGFATVGQGDVNNYTTPYAFPYAANGWSRVEHSLKNSTINNADGWFKTTVGESNTSNFANIKTRDASPAWTAGTYSKYQTCTMIKPAGSNAGVLHYFQCTADGVTTSPFDGAGNVQANWSLQGRQDFKENTILLGLEHANPRKFFKVLNLAPFTTYTYTRKNGSNVDVNYSYTSGSTTPTLTEIFNSIISQTTAAGYTDLKVYGNLISNGAANEGTFNSQFAVDENKSVRMMVSDVYADTSLSRFIVGDNAIYSACTIRDPQPYFAWVASQAKFIINSPTITGTKYLFYIDNNETIYALGAMQESGVHNA